jgi:hypothetical protein
VTLDAVLSAATEMLRQHGVPPPLIASARERLEGTRLTDSRLRLILAYKRTFEAIRLSSSAW